MTPKPPLVYPLAEAELELRRHRKELGRQRATLGRMEARLDVLESTLRTLRAEQELVDQVHTAEAQMALDAELKRRHPEWDPSDEFLWQWKRRHPEAAAIAGAGAWVELEPMIPPGELVEIQLPAGGVTQAIWDNGWLTRWRTPFPFPERILRWRPL